MAETKSLSQFKSKLAGGGAPTNLFEVSIPSFPGAVSEAWGSGDDGENGTFKFLCKAANLPASVVATVDIPFRGRTLKVAGDRTINEHSKSVRVTTPRGPIAQAFMARPTVRGCSRTGIPFGNRAGSPGPSAPSPGRED